MKFPLPHFSLCATVGKTMILLTVISIAASLYNCQAQNTWVKKADFGGAARTIAVGFSIGNKGYIGTGADAGGVKKDFWEYDPDMKHLDAEADFGGTARKAAVGFSIGSKGYIGTGYDNGCCYLNDFWNMMPLRMTGQRKPPLEDQQDFMQSDFPSVAKGISVPASEAVSTLPMISGNMILLPMPGRRKRISGEQKDMRQSDFPSAAKGYRYRV
jgi:hypothetical protein